MSEDDKVPDGTSTPSAQGDASPPPKAKRAAKPRGKKFGRYTLLQRIAHGGMGEIFLARQSGHGGFSKLVAIKRILAHFSGDDEHVQMFFDEAKLQAILNDRHIVQIYDMGKVGDHLFIAMEYVHGISMRRLIRRINKREMRVHPAHTCELMIQVCRGLSYAHNVSNSQGQKLQIVHRDINPQNLLISFDGEVKIIDFGIAKSEMSEVHTESGTLKGKFTYMSPEQGAGAFLDRRSDIFSVGICLYELLTGFNPFKRANLVLSLAAIQQEDTPLISTIREDAVHFEPILKKALARNRDERFEDCTHMGETLQDLIHSGKCGREPAPFGEWIKGLFKSEIQEHLGLLRQMGSISEIALHSGPTLRRTSTAALPIAPSTLLADEDSQSVSSGIIIDRKRSTLDEDEDSQSDGSGSASISHIDIDILTVGSEPGSAPGTDTTNTGIRLHADDNSLSLQYPLVRPKNIWASLLPGIVSGLLLGVFVIGFYFLVFGPDENEPPPTESPIANVQARKVPSSSELPSSPGLKAPAKSPAGDTASQQLLAGHSGSTLTKDEDDGATPALPADAKKQEGETKELGTNQTITSETDHSSRPTEDVSASTKKRTTSRIGKKRTSIKSKKRTASARMKGKLGMRISGGYRFEGGGFKDASSASITMTSSQKRNLKIRGKGKSFEIQMTVQEKGGKILLSIKSSPWAIVRVNNISSGKTPTRVTVRKNQVTKVALKNPKAGEVKMSFKWSPQ